MSGVVDKNGQQWEHCNNCGEWVKILDLFYGPMIAVAPKEKWLDLCLRCAERSQSPDVQRQVREDRAERKARR